MPASVWLALAILCEVAATSLLRQTHGFTRALPSVAVTAGYATSFWCLSLALRTLPVGVAYAIWSGAGIVLVTAIAWIARGEQLDAISLGAMALIVAGAMVLQLRGAVG